MADDSRGILAADVSGDIPGKFWPNDESPIFYERSVNSIIGPSGVGKSIAVIRVVADVSRTLGPVIYCNAEDDKVMQAYRLNAAGADMDKVTLAKYVLPHEAFPLEQAIRRLGAKLVVFDTAAKHIAGPMQRWDMPLEQLHYILEATGCAGILVHHTNKGVKENADWRAAVGGATSGIVGTSRALSLFGRALDDPATCLMCPVKDSYADTPKAIRMEFRVEEFDQPNGLPVDIAYHGIIETGVSVPNPTALVVVQGKNGDTSKGPAPEKMAEAAEFLTNALADGPRAVKDTYRCLTHPDSQGLGSNLCGHKAVKEVEANSGACPDCQGPMQATPGLMTEAEGTGISWGTIKRAKDGLTLVTARKGFGGGGIFYWRLPDGHPSLNPLSGNEFA